MTKCISIAITTTVY